jgi:hypothetical protein
MSAAQAHSLSAPRSDAVTAFLLMTRELLDRRGWWCGYRYLHKQLAFSLFSLPG